MGADRLGNRFNQRRNHIEPNFADWIRFLRWGNKVGTFLSLEKKKKKEEEIKKDLQNSGRAMTTKDWTNFPSFSLVLNCLFGWQRDSTTTGNI